MKFSFFVLPIAVLSLMLPTMAQGNQKPRVAVFFEPGFPFYMASPLTSPRAVAKNLREAGIEADLMDTKALADAARFNKTQYAAAVLSYGNAYPREAFAGLQAFHRAGGALVLSGIPFTHAVDNSSLGNWTPHPLWGSNVRSTTAAHSGARALELKGMREWAGVDSPRFAAQPGDRFQIEAWAQNVTGEVGNDHLYVRFFDADGQFINQQGPVVTANAEWHRVGGEVTAPAHTTHWDFSPQIRTYDRVLRLDDVKVTLNGTLVSLLNADFETPGSDWVDLGHESAPALFGANGIGAGGFAGPGAERSVAQIAPGDPLSLASLKINWPASIPQWLDARSLPGDVKVMPALLWQGHALSALLQYPNGAVTVWTNHPALPDADGYLSEQLLMRGVVAALSVQNRLTANQAQALFARLDRLPSPARYANLKLPRSRRPYATFHPKMPLPASHLFVVDMRRLPYDERLLLTSLQGIVNRKQPRIYLIFGEDDRFWLGEMQRRGQTGAPVEVKEALSLLDTFRGEVRGAVIPDPGVYDSACVAASLAGADSLVIATPQLVAQWKLPVRADLRGKFADNPAALRYLRTDIFPRLNPYIAMCADPSSLDNGAVDHVIAARGAVFWVTGPKAQIKPGADTARELEELQALLAKMPLGAVVRGFWWHGDGEGLDEGPGVSLASRFGKVTVVSDGVVNSSVFSGVPLQSLRQKPRPAAPTLDKTKKYIALTMSDGDNLSTWRNYFRGYFNDPLHGTFPIGWGMGPTLLDVAPTWAQWYYDKATSGDEFICDVSGVGYIYPPDWSTALSPDDRAHAERAFYNWTQDYMERMDMHALRLMNVETKDIARVGAMTPRVEFLLPDYGYGGSRTYPELTYTLPTGQPVFRAISYDGSPEKMAADIRSRIGTSYPAFANVFIWNWGAKMSDLKKLLDLLGPEYVAVTPSQLAALYRQAQAKP